MNNNILFYVIIFVPFTILIFLDTRDLFEDKKKKKESDVVDVTSLKEIAAAGQVPLEAPLTSPPNEKIQENKEVKEETKESKE